ncbi:MAG TPA: hypothetical protein VMT74_03280 [Gaiellaceae bacterium]|nr:hypothetical protein [Gaiellaceae bacterium]
MPVPLKGRHEDKSGTYYVGDSKVSLTDAMEKAYEVAKPDYKGKTIELLVEAIYVKGTNPISEWVVKMGPLPGA